MATRTGVSKMKFNQYKSTAEFYDLDFAGSSYNDIEFYLSLVKPRCNELLELCCGTGRITIPFAQNRINVFALDFSKEMLSIFKSKLKLLDSEISERITLIKADMSNFKLNKEFKCILIPFHSFQSLTDPLKISQTLETVYRHLTDEGVFILNVFKPRPNMKTLEGLSETRIVTNSQGEALYQKNCINTLVDTTNQVLYYDIIYYLYKKEEKAECIAENLKAKYYYIPQLTKLLEKHNFYIENLHHGFDKNLPGALDSSELTLVCKKQLLKYH